MPSGGCLLHFLVNSQIFSMIKISVENRLKKRNVHRFTITVRRMYILCKPCPAACMTLSFRCGSGRRLTELARIVQRPAHIIRYFLSFSYREVRLMPSILAARARLPSASSRVLRSSCFSFSSGMGAVSSRPTARSRFSSSGEIHPSAESRTARWMQFLSSRMLPGQGYFCNEAAARLLNPRTGLRCFSEKCFTKNSASGRMSSPHSERGGTLMVNSFRRKYSINSLVYWVTYVHNVVYSFYRSMIYCYINSTQRCAGSIVIDIIPTNGADKRKFFPFAPYFPVTNVIKRYFYPYFPAIIGIKGYSFPYFPYLSGIMKIKTALYSLFSRLDWHKTVVFPCLGEIYEGIRSLSWEIPVT